MLMFHQNFILGECVCPKFYRGELCEELICVNNGTLVKIPKLMPVQYACRWASRFCSCVEFLFEVLRTSNNQFRMCLKTKFRCAHPEYIHGTHCELVKCLNGGRPMDNGYCKCLDYWYTGQFCQVVVKNASRKSFLLHLWQKNDLRLEKYLSKNCYWFWIHFNPSTDVYDESFLMIHFPFYLIGLAILPGIYGIVGCCARFALDMYGDCNHLLRYLSLGFISKEIYPFSKYVLLCRRPVYSQFRMHAEVIKRLHGWRGVNKSKTKDMVNRMEVEHTF